MTKKLLNDTAKLKNEKNEKKPQDYDLNNKNNGIDDKSKNKNAVAISTFSENENLQNAPISERFNSALIIKKNRQRSFQLGNLIDEIIESVYHIRNEVLALDIDEKTALDEIETKIALVNYKMKIIN